MPAPMADTPAMTNGMACGILLSEEVEVIEMRLRGALEAHCHENAGNRSLTGDADKFMRILTRQDDGLQA